MATINRLDNTSLLNTGAAWSGGVAPGSADVATWSGIVTNISTAIGGSVSWGGIALGSGQTANITIASSIAATLTLGASGLNLSASGANFTINTINITLALNAAQTWSVASGRTVTMTNRVSGDAKNVQVTGAGTTTLSQSNTGWTNSQVRVSGGLVIGTVGGALGAASNTVVVDGTGAVRFTGGSGVVAQTSFTVSGSGASGLQSGAIYFADGTTDFGAGKTITLTGASPVIGLSAPGQAGVIAGTPTGDVTWNLIGTASNATLTTQQTFTVASGSYLVLQGVNPTTGVSTVADFGLSGSDGIPFGAAGNAVKVRSTARLTNLSASTLAVTLSRNYFFDGESTNAAPVAPNGYSIWPTAAAGSSFTFTGTISGTAGNWVKANANGGTTAHTVQFGSLAGGKLDGSWSIRSFSSVQTLYLHPSLDISTWTGAIYAYRVSYGVAPTGAATYESGAVIDNIKGSALTLAHSSYTLVAGLTFTGSADLSLGSGNVSTGASPTFTTSASTLTIPGTVTGTGTFTKAAIGGLALGGATSGYTAYAHTGGTLTLNNNNALGTSTATLTLTAAVANTLDSTTGATLANTGTNAFSADFTWGGSGDLTLGSGNVTLTAARVITFVGGKTGTLKAPGNINTASAFALTIGGASAATQSRFWLVGTNALTSSTHSVTAGYFRVSNAGGLGNATTVAWTVSSGAALELEGGIAPTSARNVTITGPGPNVDGALRSVNGTASWNGAILVPVQSLASPTRIQVDAGTFTLAAGTYTTINPTTSGTPLQFTALGATARLNQPRQLTSNVSDVTINNGGVGTVELSVANNHTGGTTVQGGKCRVTHITATSTGTVQVDAGATLESTVQSQFTTLRLGTTGSGARAVLAFAA